MIPTLLAVLVLAAEAPVDPAAANGSTGLPAARPARAATVAVVPADTLARIPGSTLRLGWTPERAASAGSAGSGEIDTRWFGSAAKARLTFREERLAEVHLTATGVSRRFSDYLFDELRRQGYRRVSHTIAGGSDRSEWRGRAVVQLTAGGGNVTADVSPLPRAVPAVPVPSPVAVTEPGASPGAVARPATSPVAIVGPEIDFTRTGVADSLPPPRRAFAPPDPARPRIAVDAGVFGRVQVRAHVDREGKVVHAEIARGIPELNQAALGWASEVKFEPYVLGGRPAPFAVLIPVVFASRGETP